MILFDLEYGILVIKVCYEGSGFLIFYEKIGYDVIIFGKFFDLIEDLLVFCIKENGGDVVKIFVYYDLDELVEINEIKYVFLERIGVECCVVDILFFLELIIYDVIVIDFGFLEYVKLKLVKVKVLIKEFFKFCYGVDVFKFEVLVNFKYVEGFVEGEVVYM